MTADAHIKDHPHEWVSNKMPLESLAATALPNVTVFGTTVHQNAFGRQNLSEHFPDR